ncbi:PLDc N-terminal domain-containing protein [Desulfocurvus sp.]|uniref:PLDc N-terminal domain-containing protein n=1 Tax=Desulfocurvus sp. TaxID=2871698 RepID=UPI0025C660EF|nr:PLDc N-terminal domain-containing protein [Desulfocurvus sp.]MCK9240681.1 PLDc N-terminal domain-containing protein [Desulfocurvus sp.]
MTSTLAPWFLVVLDAAGICLFISFWAIWHAYWRVFPTSQEKALWLVGVVMLPVLGGLAYLFFGRNRGRSSR